MQVAAVGEGGGAEDGLLVMQGLKGQAGAVGGDAPLLVSAGNISRAVVGAALAARGRDSEHHTSASIQQRV